MTSFKGKPAICRGNSVFIDQPFPFVYTHILYLNCAENEESVFCRCSYVTKSPCFDQTPHRARGD